MTPLVVLFVEDSEDDVLLLQRELRKGGYAVESRRVASAEDLRAALPQRPWDVIISDYVMPGFGGLEALQIIRQSNATVPCILISGTVGEEIAVESIKAGADDYLMKHNLLRLVPAVRRALQDAANARARQKAERELRESQELLALIHDNVSDAITLTTEADDGRWVFTKVNRAFLELLARHGRPATEADVLGRTPEEVEYEWLNVQGTSVTPRREIRNIVRTTLTPQSTELTFDGPAGRWMFEFTYVPVAGSGHGCKFILAAGRDITARKASEARERDLQQQLDQAQKLEALGTLAGGIAHDFNNLLTGMLGFVELSVRSDSLAEIRDYLSDVQQAGQRARDLVRQILTFGRRQAAVRSPQRLAGIVREVIRLLEANLPAGVQLHHTGMADADRFLIEADAGQLHQVFMNLGTNAVQAMAVSGGHLTFQLDVHFQGPDEATGLRPGRYARIQVIDTGPGMPTDVLRRVFEPFFTTKPIGHGTGLGLAVVHGLVRDHNGHVSAVSQPGQGTTFTVLLPIIDTSTYEPPRAPSYPRGRGEHLLCVDDQQTIIQVLQGMLNALGYRVTTISDPQQALDTFRATPDEYAAILTDFAMPSMTGPELAAAARDVRPDVPVLVISGYDAPRSFLEQRIHGIPMLVKPFSLSELAEAVAAALKISDSGAA